MLRLLRDRLLVSIEPAAVGWLRIAGSISPRVIAKRCVERSPVPGQPPWRGALTILSQELEGLRAEALDVSVVLSNHFVRYVVVPPAQGLANAEEQLALARFHFARVYGERSRTWHVRLAPGRGDAPRLSGAADMVLIDGLKACIPRSGRQRLVSVQPYLVSAFNTWRDRVPKEGTWLLLVEPERACLGLYLLGAWRALQNVAGRFAHPEDWIVLLERERLRAGADTLPQTALVRASSRVLGETRTDGTWRLAGLAPRPLPGFLPLEDERYVMGLCAL